MKVGVIGYGMQGSALVSILEKTSDIADIIVIDSSREKIRRCEKVSDVKKVRAFCIDVADSEKMDLCLRGCEVIFDMLTPELSENILKIALQIGANYVSTAFDEPFWSAIINQEELPFQKEFEEKGRIALLGCGDSPGLVNIFVKKYCDFFDKVTDIEIYGAYKKGASELLMGWDPGWSQKQAYKDYISNPAVFRDGRFMLLSPFAEIETKEIYRYGMRTLAAHSHEECYSLPLNIKKGLQNCIFKYEVDPAAALLYSLGFRLSKKVKIGDTEVSVVECLNKLFEEQGGVPALSEENEYTTTINIRGVSGEKEREITVALPPIYSDKKRTVEQFGVLHVEVALPAVLGMKCMRSLDPGVHFAEELSPAEFHAFLNELLPYKEVVIRDTAGILS
jgi:saccharopine dehydrogenase (NAD+, L-lysine-forming)